MLNLDRINSAQRQAVLADDAPLLILAGAGTGKTTTITYRIAHRVQQGFCQPWQVLAVTFTNKAANEMRIRTAKLLGTEPEGLSIGTFHRMCGRILRREGQRLGLSQNFIIYDSDDQLRLLKRCMADLNIDTQIYAPARLRYWIEQWKNQGRRPQQVEPSALDPAQRLAHKLYLEYQKRLLDADAVDFGDMLVHTLHLVREHEDIRSRLQQKWTHLFVDEYQDTNPVQYALLKQLVTPTHALTVVGDDDQSIYSWRGADIQNILRFERDFEGARLIRLEHNYRSSATILEAANALIANNRSRKGKVLFTESGAGEPISLKVFASERGEAEAVADNIASTLAEGTPAAEIAVLFRTNAQSRALEASLRRRQIDYAMIGGLRFYDRKEVKDALAYLRLVLNPASEIDFLRVVNAPARGIGKTSLEKLGDWARGQSCTLFEAARAVAHSGGAAIRGKAKNALVAFAELVEQFHARRIEPDVTSLLQDLLERSGYLQALRAQGTEESEERLQNISELMAAIDEYVDLSDTPSLADFLESVTLAADVDNLQADGGRVVMMTLHAAKGLEFDVVHMVGLEEGIFPHSRSSEDPSALEEERRLCYVGITRARHRLHLSAATSRMIFGRSQFSQTSRFLSEIPIELLDVGTESSRLPGFSDEARPWLGAQDDDRYADDFFDEESDAGGSVDLGNPFAVGRRVHHQTFGEGTIQGFSDDGIRQKLSIAFDNGLEKTVVARFVKPL